MKKWQKEVVWRLILILFLNFAFNYKLQGNLGYYLMGNLVYLIPNVFFVYLAMSNTQTERRALLKYFYQSILMKWGITLILLATGLYCFWSYEFLLGYMFALVVGMLWPKRLYHE